MGPSSIIGSQNNGGPKHGKWKMFEKKKIFFLKFTPKTPINPFHEKLFSEW